jgi:hypothetical protein
MKIVAQTPAFGVCGYSSGPKQKPRTPNPGVRAILLEGPPARLSSAKGGIMMITPAWVIETVKWVVPSAVTLFAGYFGAVYGSRQVRY